VINKSKILSSQQGIDCMLNEIRVHWALEHCPCVLSLIAIHEDKESIYLVLEYQPQGTLLNIMQK
jgi:hypothetical protein